MQSWAARQAQRRLSELGHSRCCAQHGEGFARGMACLHPAANDGGAPDMPTRMAQIASPGVRRGPSHSVVAIGKAWCLAARTHAAQGKGGGNRARALPCPCHTGHGARVLALRTPYCVAAAIDYNISIVLRAAILWRR